MIRLATKADIPANLEIYAPYVLETGSISMSGDAHELAEDDRVRKAYLGES